MTQPFDVTPHVDAELRVLVPGLQQVTAAGPLTAEALPALRSTIPAFLPRPRAEPAWTPRMIPSAAGAPDVRVVLIDPGGAGAGPRPAVLHLHGGGFVMGSAEHSLWRTQEIAESLGCLVVSVDYRLAPETPFPGALDDNYAALAWLHSHADELGVDRARIALVGESAGGGHAATLAITARDRGEIPLRFLGLAYPMLDDRTGATVLKPPHMGAIVWNAQPEPLRLELPARRPRRLRGGSPPGRARQGGGSQRVAAHLDRRGRARPVRGRGSRVRQAPARSRRSYAVERRARRLPRLRCAGRVRGLQGLSRRPDRVPPRRVHIDALHPVAEGALQVQAGSDSPSDARGVGQPAM